MRTPLRLLLPLAVASVTALPGPTAADEGWVTLFDGRTLAGWKAAENPASFRVVDGTIACDGSRAHLFYVGPDGKASFENFEAEVEVRARAGANSGFYFHTAFQEKDWPAQGFEVQVDNSQERHGDYLELKMTGSLYGRPTCAPPVGEEGGQSLVKAGRGSRADRSASSRGLTGLTAPRGADLRRGWPEGARRAEAGEGSCRACAAALLRLPRLAFE